MCIYDLEVLGVRNAVIALRLVEIEMNRQNHFPIRHRKFADGLDIRHEYRFLKPRPFPRIDDLRNQRISFVFLTEQSQSTNTDSKGLFRVTFEAKLLPLIVLVMVFGNILREIALQQEHDCFLIHIGGLFNVFKKSIMYIFHAGKTGSEDIGQVISVVFIFHILSILSTDYFDFQVMEYYCLVVGQINLGKYLSVDFAGLSSVFPVHIQFAVDIIQATRKSIG